MNLHGLSDSVAGVIESPAQCRQCGATTRLGNGLCLSCTLREGLEGDREESRESFEAILAEDEVRDTHWRVGNYEILEEIGRGGMGVIYRARQRHSRRIVALKRLVSYHADSRETLERFRREAEAAASLDHPNILPIYEVGQGEDGLPFFSMKYATGGSLQKAGPALRNELRECVRLMAKVGRAVQYAHEHGVLHRDLKPGNILLDGQGEPFVTDFGLAKWLDTSTDLTRTLAIFGTPGYIAPEQAKGPAANLTPTADVYSLGAILFDLFTGRPPFLGEHALAVIQQASEKPAPKLRVVAPTLDRDLETICGRCLEREPQARYRSADALAVDLERWLEERPIIARRVSPPVRVWRWSKRSPKLAAATAAAFCSAMAAAFLFFSHNGLAPQSGLDSRLPPEKSIAMLPFENLGRDPDNAYFAEGIQDEILTRLSKIADLKVTSRTSTQHYKTAPTNLPDIARELGVAHILEGSVQKSSDGVRVNVQLIKAADDSHLWADTFDRKLTDIFSVESEVAKAIADQLRVKLTGREKEVVAAKPTGNPEAYDNYLRGLAYTLRTGNNSANALGAQKYLKEAVRLDPKFALAWALLSYTDAVGYRTLTLQPTVDLREEARQAAENALTLQPNLGEAVLAKGYYHYSCLNDFDTAERYFGEARRLLPNSSRISESLAYLERRRGGWERSEAYFNEAERLDPRNVNLLTQHALFYMLLRRGPEALRKLDQVLNITPDDMDTLTLQAAIAQGEGDLSRAAALLAPLHPSADDATVLETQVYQAILERRPAPIIPRLKEILAKPDPALGYINGELRLWLGWAQDVGGDHAAAQESWQQARNELEAFLKEQPENVQLITNLALINMGLGDKAAALALAERAMAALPLEKDAMSGSGPIEILARVAAQTGETDRAIAALQKLLSIPAITDTSAPFTPALLRLDPMFDPLRNDPRFEKLVEAAKEPVATVPAKSIAVLPFENLSRDPDNAYFAEGVQDEILTRLSKIADLKVISRTSTQHYKNAPENLPEIARQLGVANILEGSVQKNGDSVRVNVQLIKAASDSHLWADTFDRKLTDIFSVESEVAKAIADQLRAKLTGREEQVIAAKSTDNTDAYDAYLRGLAYTLKPLTTANALGAQKHLKEAVRLDPKFAHAWALLSYTDALGYIGLTLQPTVALREEARQAAETALTLLPNLGEAMLAKGQYYYGCLKDYDAAVRYFEQARPLLPNNSRIPQSMASVTRRQGQWDRHESYLNEAERLDPRNVILLAQHALSYSFLRRFPEAKQKLDQVLEITPGDADTLAIKAAIAQAEGDLPAAAALFSPLRRSADPAALEQQVYQAILERRPAQMITRLKELLAKPDPALGYFNRELRFYLGWAQEVGGDHAAAQESWRQARSELEALLAEQPENHNLIADLALTNMGLADKAAAFAFVDKGIALVPIEKDAVDGTIPIEILARVAAQMGEPDRAIAALQKILLVPGSGALAEGIPLTPALLRRDPTFDPLRNDSRFQELSAPAGAALSAPAQIPQKSFLGVRGVSASLFLPARQFRL